MTITAHGSYSIFSCKFIPSPTCRTFPSCQFVSVPSAWVPISPHSPTDPGAVPTHKLEVRDSLQIPRKWPWIPLCYLSTIIKCFSPAGSSVLRGVLLHFGLVDNEASEKLYFILRKRRKILMFARSNPKPFLLPCCHLVTNPAPAPKRPKLRSNRSNFQTPLNHNWCRHQTLQNNSFLIGRLTILVDAAPLSLAVQSSQLTYSSFYLEVNSLEIIIMGLEDRYFFTKKTFGETAAQKFINPSSSLQHLLSNSDI